MLRMLSGGAPTSGQAPPFSLPRNSTPKTPVESTSVSSLRVGNPPMATNPLAASDEAQEEHVSDVSGSQFFSFFLSRARFCCGNRRLKEKEENREPLTTTDH
jgi:hypothetical protein